MDGALSQLALLWPAAGAACAAALVALLAWCAAVDARTWTVPAGGLAGAWALWLASAAARLLCAGGALAGSLALEALLAFGILAALAAASRASRGRLGMGDAKLIPPIAALLGSSVIPALLVACATLALEALLSARRAPQAPASAASGRGFLRTPRPFVPHLLAGVVAALALRLLL